MKKKLLVLIGVAVMAVGGVLSSTNYQTATARELATEDTCYGFCRSYLGDSHPEVCLRLGRDCQWDGHPIIK